MYGPINQPSVNRQLIVDMGRTRAAVYSDPFVHRQRIWRELKAAGLGWWALSQGECRYLPRIIQADEHVGGAVYGHNEAGSVLLVATDRRAFFVDKKPLFVTEDQINYDVVSGVSLGHAGVGSTVTLHTRVKDFKVRTFNAEAAQRFTDYVEWRALEHVRGEPRRGQVD